MAFTTAGRYGPETILSNDGTPQVALSCVITKAAGGAAVLYTDKTKTTTTSNSVLTNSIGNLIFFADPGDYVITCTLNGVTTILNVTVPIDPGEAAQDSDIAGETSTYRLMTKLHEALVDASIVVLGDSTGDATNEWPYLVLTQIAALWPAWTVKYRPVLTDGSAYDTAVTLQTGTGARTLTMHNASVSGKNTYFPQAPYFTAQLVTPDPDLVIISHGHNEGPATSTNLAATIRGRFIVLTEMIRQALPYAGILLIQQNPHTDSSSAMAVVNREIALVATARGHGLCNVHQAFLDDSRWVFSLPNDLMLNSVHPNAAGEAVWAAEVIKKFVYAPNAQPRTEVISSFDEHGLGNLGGPIIIPLGTTEAIGWTRDNATVAQDTTHFVTGRGYGIRVVGTAGGAKQRIYKQLLDSTQVKAYRGAWLTMCIPVYRNAANRFAGTIELQDGVGSQHQAADDFTSGAFTWRVLPYYVDPAATTLLAVLYADFSGVDINGANIASTVTFGEELIIVPGQWPKGHGDTEVDHLRSKTSLEQLTVGDAAKTDGTFVTAKGAAASSVVYEWRSGDLRRFDALSVASAETGSNVGSDLLIRAFNDAGTLLNTPLTIKRSTGLVTLAYALQYPSYTTAQRNALGSAVGTGGTVYDTTLHFLVTFDGTNWRDQAANVV